MRMMVMTELLIVSSGFQDEGVQGILFEGDFLRQEFRALLWV
jgi:hypothetical protein